MADSTVDALTAASALDGTEEYYAVQGGADRKVTGAQIKTLASASPTLVTPALGTPASGVMTNVTGTAAGLTAGHVTTNADLTGDVTSSGNATILTNVVRRKLTADTTWYVRTDGSDSNTGLVDSAGGAFLTIQKAVDTVCKTIDLAGYVATIQVADGTYAEEILLSDYVGEGGVRTVGPEREDLAVKLIGNETTPTNVVLTGINPSVQFRVLRIANSKEWLVTGFSFAPVNFQDGIECHYATLRLGVIDFGTGTGGYGIWVPSRSTVIIEESGKISWSGNGWAGFVTLYDGAWMRCFEHTTLNFNANVDFSIFAEVGEGAALHLQRLDALALNGHTVTGWKYALWNGGSLRVDKNVGGDVNPFDLPGSTPGVVLDYGYYNGVELHGNRTWTAGAHEVTANYTLVHDDGDTTVYVNSATAKTITLPATFAESWRCKIVQEGAGAVNFTAAAGGTKQGLAGLTTQYSAAILEVKANADDLSAAWRIVLEDISAGGGGLTIGTTTITGGTTLRLLYDNAGAVGEGLLRYSAANLFLGDVDAASPVAQTLSPQNVVTGTADTAGANFVIAGSRSTGAAQGGSLLFKTSDINAASTTQNTLTTAFTIGAANPAAGGLRSVSFDSSCQIAIGELQFVASGHVLTDSGGGQNSVLRITTNSSQRGIFVGTNFAEEALGFLSGNYNNDADTVFTRSAAAKMQMGFIDAAAPVAQTLQAQSVVAGTADTAGTAWTFQASKGTGTGAGGNIVDKTAFSAKSTGSGQGTAVDRKVIVAKGKVLTDATPVSLFEIALPTLAMCGGQIEATVVCTNGTDMQSFTQTISYSAVNKGGVYTKSITASTGDKSVTGGSTLANTWSILDGTNKVTVQLSSDTSLTPSSNAFMVYYSVKNNSEQATTIL